MSNKRTFSRLLKAVFTGLWLLAAVPGAQAQTLPPPMVALPQDEAPHALPMEWWYYTGKLQVLGEPQTYGVEAVVFQFSIPGMPVYYMSHAAVTDVDGETFHHGQEFSFTDQRPLQPESGFDLTTGGIRLAGQGRFHHVQASIPDYAMDLCAYSLKPVTLMDGDGFETLGNAGMFYYSYPRMAAAGTLTVKGVKKPVVGTLWSDHQWGAPGSDVAGWDWFSLRLDDLTEVMGFTLRLQNGTLSKAATYIKRNGTFEPLPPGDLVIEPTGSWTSPRTGVTYPQGWRFIVHSLALTADLTPVLPDQEIVYTAAPGAPQQQYWEGLCRVSATKNGRAVKGSAYVELTGYQ